MLEFSILEPEAPLRDHVECVRLARYDHDDTLTLNACPTGHPEIVFHHRLGGVAVENITVATGRVVHPPVLFLHGQITEVARMTFRGPFTTVQVVLKPFALRSLFGLDAALLANASMTLEALPQEYSAPRDLESALIAAPEDDRRIALLSEFLRRAAGSAGHRDPLVEEGITQIERDIAQVTVREIVQRIGLSERQFERRFMNAVGIAPQLYIRIRRINEAFRLMDSGRYDRLSDIAYSLNYYDQSHFIREVRTFSGITPKGITQKVNDFHHDVASSSYLFSQARN